jgi:hypothetical protein
MDLISLRIGRKPAAQAKPRPTGSAGINPRSIDVLAAHVRRHNPDISRGASVAIAALAVISTAHKSALAACSRQQRASDLREAST